MTGLVDVQVDDVVRLRKAQGDAEIRLDHIVGFREFAEK